MKKIFTQFAIALMATIAISIHAQAATVVSAQDGDWNNGATWAGGIAPTSADSVVVQHMVNILNGDSCMHLYVAPAGTLQNKVNGSRTLVITGNFYVDGTVTYTNNYFYIRLGGNLQLNGIWSSPRVTFIGSTGQSISATPGKIFNTTRSGVFFEDEDAGSPISFLTDVTFVNIEMIMNGTAVEFAPNIEVAVSDKAIRYANITGNNSALKLSGGAYTDHCTLDNLVLKGLFNLGTGNTASGEIVNEDTLQNLLNGTRTFQVNGNFTNNGLITETNNHLHLVFTGDVTNTGIWNSSDVYFNGTSDQHVDFAPDTWIYCNNIYGQDTLSDIVLDNNWEIHHALIDMSNALIDVSGYQLTLRDNASIRYAVIHQAQLGGAFTCYKGCVFTGETVVLDTLQKNNANSQIPVTFEGDLINNGIIIRYNGYALQMTLYGDFEVNGPVDVEDLIFAGASDQNLYSTTKNSVINVDQVYDTDPTSSIILGSDFTFIDADIDLSGATLTLANGNMTMQDGKLLNGTLVSDNRYFEQHGTAYLKEMQVASTILKGKCQLWGDNNHFTDVTVEDTLQNYSTSNHTPILVVDGDFTNNGVITYGNGYKINFEIAGNFYNYGKFNAKKINFTGDADQFFESPNFPVTDTDVTSSKTAGDIFAVGAVLLNGCDVDLNWGKFNLLDDDLMITGGALTGIIIGGNGHKIIVDGGGTATNVTFEQLFIEGKIYFGGNNNAFHDVTLTDTITHRSGYSNDVYIYSTGDFINNGHIIWNTSYGIEFYVEDRVVNNGEWKTESLVFNGDDMHYIESQNGNPFEIDDILIGTKGGDVTVENELYLLNAVLDFGGRNLYLPEFGLLDINGCTIKNAIVTCEGEEYADVVCTGKCTLNTTIFDHLSISGTVDLRPNTFTDCILNGIMQNDDVINSYPTQWFEGVFENNGSVINHPGDNYKLDAEILGHVYNDGIWEIRKNYWKGEDDQDIYILNDNAVNTPSEFWAMLGTGGYQWYKNGLEITGATGSTLNFASITANERGFYQCETNEGSSRIIRVCTPVEIDLVSEAWFCQYESVMIEATPLTGNDPFTYSWSPATGLSDPTIANPLANPSVPTLYTVTITDSIGCRGEAQVFVQQYPQLYADAGDDEAICYGSSTVLQGSASGGEPGYVYSWTPATGLSDPGIANPTANPDETTTYTLTVTDGNGCWETDDVTVTVNPLPIPYVLTLGGHFCDGVLAAIVEVANSEVGVDYYLMRDGVLTGDVLAGTGSYLEFYTTPLSGTYTVKGINATTNCENMMTGAIPVEVDYAPVITAQTQDDARVVNSQFTFFVDATGTEPLTYTWYHDGEPVYTSAANTYTIPSLSLDDAGEYWCDVENNCGIAETDVINLIVLDAQIVNIPAGWSGLSTYLDVWDAEVEKIFQYINSQLIIVNDFEQMYWPAQGINTYSNGEWNTYLGAQIKLTEAATVEFDGLHPDDLSINLNPGWYYLPVLDHCPVAADDVFSPINSKLDIVKDIAGTRVYWPQYGITTLNTLEPGLAYLIKVNEPCEITFSVCQKSGAGQANALRPENTDPWPEPVYSPTSHVIALPENVAAGTLLPGDRIGVFNSENTCCGFAQYTGGSISITAFGDDPGTAANDGLTPGEPMTLRLYRPATGETFVLVPLYDAYAGETNYFAVNGISVISALKAEATGMEDAAGYTISVYPSPTHGILFIDGIVDKTTIEITNASGQLIYHGQSNSNTSVNLTGKPAGLYMVKISGNQKTFIQSVMVE